MLNIYIFTCSGENNLQILKSFEFVESGLHFGHVGIVHHMQTADSVVICRYKRRFSLLQRQHWLGHVTEFGRERSVFQLVYVWG